MKNHDKSHEFICKNHINLYMFLVEIFGHMIFHEKSHDILYELDLLQVLDENTLHYIIQYIIA